MNSNKLREGIGFIDEDLIAGAIEYTRARKKNGWMKWAAMAACLCLVVTLSIPLIFDRGQSSEPIPGGVVAEVIEIIDINKWKVVITGTDRFHSLGDVVCVTIENTANSKTEFNLDIGDVIAVTYSNHDIIEHKDGSIEILVPDIELIE